VLVVPYTTPAYNVVLPLAGAIVTVEGGPLSHAAVLARELGLPAVVGVVGALTLPDGALVEVDATAGRVSVVDRAAAVATA
jgi:phosphoenolpyruvate synthase/pyruvate phosphate dikinase